MTLSALLSLGGAIDGPHPHRAGAVCAEGALLNRRSFLLLPLALAAFTLLREWRLIRLVDVDPRRSSSASSSSSTSGLVVDPSWNSRSSDEEEDDPMQPRRKPEIVWLASYPNSGTSYTMTLVERATNLSTATHYGLEVTPPGESSLSVYGPDHVGGPYWEGLHGKMGTIPRELPDSYVLTKTHCGGRCVYCGASQYTTDGPHFLRACLRSSGRGPGGLRRNDTYVDPASISKVVHLIRNPLHNVVARYHLDRRHLVSKNASEEVELPLNATGFHKWCHRFDYNDAYRADEDAILDGPTIRLLRKVPCRAEFYKYAQWHQRLFDATTDLLPTYRHRRRRQPTNDVVPILVVHYEDYQYTFNATAQQLMDFVEQTPIQPFRPFRSLPTYHDHFSNAEIRAVRDLLRHLTSPRLWPQLERYFTDPFSANFSSSSMDQRKAPRQADA